MLLFIVNDTFVSRPVIYIYIYIYNIIFKYERSVPISQICTGQNYYNYFYKGTIIVNKLQLYKQNHY